MATNGIIGRVLRASTQGYAVGCRVNQLEAVAFGSLVKACPINAHEGVYGLIYDIHIDDDPLARRLVLGENPAPEVIQDQRENRLLPVEMSVLTVGYAQNGRIYHRLPPRPPLNLDPVQLCTDQKEISRFTNHLGYLRLILQNQSSNIPIIQLLVGHVVSTWELRGQDTPWALGIIQELTELLRSNYDILIPAMEALSDALPGLTEAPDRS